MFNKFKDGLGIFNEDLSKDVEGLLSLYEAAHLRVHGEDILEEALAFTTSHLERLKTQLKNELQSKKVIYALETPVWWNMNRVEARRYISVYALEDSHNETLLNFAILDFNLLQKVYQGELVTITRYVILSSSSVLNQKTQEILCTHRYLVGMNVFSISGGGEKLTSLRNCHLQEIEWWNATSGCWGYISSPNTS